MSRIKRVVWPALQQADEPGGIAGFSAAAIVVGAMTGLIAASFRLSLDWVSAHRNDFLSWSSQLHPAVGLSLVVLVCATGAALAASLVHRVEPHAEGSGIPRVESVVVGKTKPGSPMILPVKFIGGLLSIGVSGLALGREGPSVQMGGNIGIIIARITRRNSHDLRVLVAAGAAAGLATAFNAPIAGGVFVLEELVRRFRPRTTIATLLASASGFAVSRVMTGGTDSLFPTAAMREPQLSDIWIMIVVGLVTGLAGAGYNWLILSSLNWADLSKVPREVRAALIGGLVGVVGYFAPDLIGGGDILTERALTTQLTIGVVVGVLAIRVVLGVISYAAATPGGLFAPMLVVGSHLGLLIGLLGQQIAPQWTPTPAALALAGIAAFFTASVQAPVTGLVLATELTGVTDQLPPMLAACAIAMLTAMLLRSVPIYDALSARAAAAAKLNAEIAHPLHPGSP